MSTDKMVMNTIIISAGFFSLLFGVTAVGFVLQWFEFKLEPVYLFIALIPFIILLIVSGKLKEIRGPGGVALVLHDEAEKPVSPQFAEAPLEVDPQVVKKKGTRADLLTRIYRRPPTTLSFQVRKRGYYGPGPVQEYVSHLEKHRQFRFILLNDEEGRFLGLMRLADYKQLGGAEQFIEKLESGEILKDPNVIRDSTKEGATNKQALDQMEREKTEVLAVEDSKGRFVGVVEQGEIVRKILIKVLGAA